MGFLFFSLRHPREGIFPGLDLLLFERVLIGEYVIIAHLILFLDLLLFLALGLKTELKIIELVQGLELFVADRDSIWKDAFAEGLERLL